MRHSHIAFLYHIPSAYVSWPIADHLTKGFLAVKRHHDQGNSYKRQHLPGSSLQVQKHNEPIHSRNRDTKLTPKYPGPHACHWTPSMGETLVGDTVNSLSHHVLLRGSRAEISHPGRDIKGLEGRSLKNGQRKTIDEINTSGGREKPLSYKTSYTGLNGRAEVT